MGKRSEGFEKISRDFYPTIDPVAGEALARVIGPYTYYIEPCCGSGDLVNMLYEWGIYCEKSTDVVTTFGEIKDATTYTKDDVEVADYFITNPPFNWKMLQPILDTLPEVLPTWLLLPADVMHNVRMGPYMKKCRKIVSIGRMYWFIEEDGKKVRGVDNYAWFEFVDHEVETKFVGRI